jgi:toxin ParE1/3/4
MRELFIRPLAVADLEGIWLYTLREWSAEQADSYLRKIDAALGRLAEDPEVGRSVKTILAGYWSLHVGRHVVFYTFTDEAVSVRRVLHDQMDMKRHL